VRNFERVIVECHPALVGESVLKFREFLRAARGLRPAATTTLEVAMGLETAHPEVLAKLNKRMTLDQFRRAAGFLREHDVALRAFVLVKPPFLDEAEALEWAKRSVDFAFDCGATVIPLIPTRPGNGALDALAARGEFSPPKLATLEAALEYGIGLKRGRVFADLWDLEQFSNCRECFELRRARLHKMNLEQVVTPRVVCDRCGTNARKH
jgi:radical SAM enzyme (TIGR01210 family)